MPEFREMRYASFCARRRARMDSVMNCINIIGALALAQITAANGHPYIGLWTLMSAFRSAAALALMLWRFSLYSRWRETLYMLLRIFWVCDVVIVRGAVRPPGEPNCSSPYLLLSLLSYGGVLGLALPALGFQLRRLGAHCIAQALSLLIIVATNSMACQLVFSSAHSPTAVKQPGSGPPPDQLPAQEIRICLDQANLRHHVKDVHCEALLCYLQVLFGFLLPTVIVWYSNQRLQEGFERLERPEAGSAHSFPHRSAAQQQWLRWKLSSSQLLGVALVTFVAAGMARRAVATPQQAPHKAVVEFELLHHTAYGEKVVVVGNGEQLGSWEVAKGKALDWHEQDKWTGELEVETGTTLEYKYVVATDNQEDGSVEIKSWQPCDNEVLEVPEGVTNKLHVVDDWSGAGHQVLQEPFKEMDAMLSSSNPVVEEETSQATTSLAAPNTSPDGSEQLAQLAGY
ncbi:hypothetical protein WJX72_008301 [[Myrmecia] bisecta]|uniref:CBM20 domain-containing protein n=1 Tax=[Myrmecia] bisecta TaxID=41462 RepID=A0AAW1QRT3_9CHLO